MANISELYQLPVVPLNPYDELDDVFESFKRYKSLTESNLEDTRRLWNRQSVYIGYWDFKKLRTCCMVLKSESYEHRTKINELEKKNELLTLIINRTAINLKEVIVSQNELYRSLHRRVTIGPSSTPVWIGCAVAVTGLAMAYFFHPVVGYVVLSGGVEAALYSSEEKETPSVEKLIRILGAACLLNGGAAALGGWVGPLGIVKRVLLQGGMAMAMSPLKRAAYGERWRWEVIPMAGAAAVLGAFSRLGIEKLDRFINSFFRQVIAGGVQSGLHRVLENWVSERSWHQNLVRPILLGCAVGAVQALPEVIRTKQLQIEFDQRLAELKEWKDTIDARIRELNLELDPIWNDPNQLKQISSGAFSSGIDIRMSGQSSADPVYSSEASQPSPWAAVTIDLKGLENLVKFDLADVGRIMLKAGFEWGKTYTPEQLQQLFTNYNTLVHPQEAIETTSPSSAPPMLAPSGFAFGLQKPPLPIPQPTDLIEQITNWKNNFNTFCAANSQLREPVDHSVNTYVSGWLSNTKDDDEVNFVNPETIRWRIGAIDRGLPEIKTGWLSWCLSCRERDARQSQIMLQFDKGVVIPDGEVKKAIQNKPRRMEQPDLKKVLKSKSTIQEPSSIRIDNRTDTRIVLGRTVAPQPVIRMGEHPDTRRIARRLWMPLPLNPLDEGTALYISQLRKKIAACGSAKAGRAKKQALTMLLTHEEKKLD